MMKNQKPTQNSNCTFRQFDKNNLNDSEMDDLLTGVGSAAFKQAFSEPFPINDDCYSADELQDYLKKNLPSEKRLTIDAHMADCLQCLRLLTQEQDIDRPPKPQTLAFIQELMDQPSPSYSPQDETPSLKTSEKKERVRYFKKCASPTSWTACLLLFVGSPVATLLVAPPIHLSIAAEGQDLPERMATTISAGQAAMAGSLSIEAQEQESPPTVFTPGTEMAVSLSLGTVGAVGSPSELFHERLFIRRASETDFQELYSDRLLTVWFNIAAYSPPSERVSQRLKYLVSGANSGNPSIEYLDYETVYHLDMDKIFGDEDYGHIEIITAIATPSTWQEIGEATSGNINLEILKEAEEAGKILFEQRKAQYCQNFSPCVG